MRVVVTLGGNALLERGDRPDAVIQRRHVRQAAVALAPLAADHQLVLCHGNGPQVGVLALESQADASLSRPYPLDVLVAQTQGMIGYWLVQELGNAGVAQRAVCVLSQTVVDPSDPAFGNPGKFIGASYSEGEARALAARLGWTIAADGPRWRRVVASPRPLGLPGRPRRHHRQRRAVLTWLTCPRVVFPVPAGLVSQGKARDVTGAMRDLVRRSWVRPAHPRKGGRSYVQRR